MNPTELKTTQMDSKMISKDTKVDPKLGQEACRNPQICEKECNQGSGRWAQESPKRSQKGALGAAKAAKMITRIKE